MPLIDIRKRLAALESMQEELVTALLESPPDQLHVYWEIVGRYRGLRQALNELRKEVDDADDE